MATTSERLQVLYEINRQLATLLNLHDLTRYVTEQARDLFRADGCALLVHDTTRGELYFPVASESRTHREVGRQLARVRFPANRGVAGWVLAEGQATIVADAAADGRFFHGVDQATGMSTRAIMAAPLRTATGTIGVIEVVNPDAAVMTSGDLEFLQALADDVALAFEKTGLYERLRGEVLSLRQVCRLGGLTLMAIGALAVVGTLLRHLALALPLTEVPASTGAVGGLCVILGGLVLLAIGRGWVGASPTRA